MKVTEHQQWQDMLAVPCRLLLSQYLRFSAVRSVHMADVQLELQQQRIHVQRKLLCLAL